MGDERVCKQLTLGGGARRLPEPIVEPPTRGLRKLNERELLEMYHAHVKCIVNLSLSLMNEGEHEREVTMYRIKSYKEIINRIILELTERAEWGELEIEEAKGFIAQRCEVPLALMLIARINSTDVLGGIAQIRKEKEVQDAIRERKDELANEC